MITRDAYPIDITIPMQIEKYFNFIQLYDQWIHSSNQTVKGLPGSPFIVSGVTDALNQLYGLYNKIGVFYGEYGYHEKVLGDRLTYDFNEADCIVVSHPFCADGMHAKSQLRIADQYDVPIFVDCAYFGICHDIDFDFTSFKNIHSVCFSMSKTFGTGMNRVGLLYTKDKFPVTVCSEFNYPLISQSILHYLPIQLKSPDWAFKTFKQKQIEVCKQLNLTPSNTIIFGLSNSDKYKKYRRGNINRVCISAMLNDKVRDTINDMDRVGQTKRDHSR